MRVWRNIGELAGYWFLLAGLLLIVVFDLARRDPMFAGALLAFAFGAWCMYQNYG